MDIRADIGATDIGARFKTNIRGCTDNSTRTSSILRIFKRISARTVRPGKTPKIVTTQVAIHLNFEEFLHTRHCTVNNNNVAPPTMREYFWSITHQKLGQIFKVVQVLYTDLHICLTWHTEKAWNIPWTDSSCVHIFSFLKHLVKLSKNCHLDLSLDAK